MLTSHSCLVNSQMVTDGVTKQFDHVPLTHCRLNALPHTIYKKILISILGMSGYVIWIFLEKNG